KCVISAPCVATFSSTKPPGEMPALQLEEYFKYVSPDPTLRAPPPAPPPSRSDADGSCGPGLPPCLPGASLPPLRQSFPSPWDRSCGHPEFRRTSHRSQSSQNPRVHPEWRPCC